MSVNKFPNTLAYTSVPTSLFVPEDGIRTNIDEVSKGLKLTLSGILTANVYKSVLSITETQGVIHRVLIYSNGNSLNIGIKIIIDGVTIITVTFASCDIDEGSSIIGSYYGSQPIPFETSCDFQVMSTTDTTDKITLATLYTTM